MQGTQRPACDREGRVGKHAARTSSFHGLLKLALVETGAGVTGGEAVARPPRSSWARTCSSSLAASKGWARKTEEYFQISSSTTSLTERTTEGEGSEM